MVKEILMAAGSCNQKTPINAVQSRPRFGALYLLSLFLIVASCLTGTSEARQS